MHKIVRTALGGLVATLLTAAANAADFVGSYTLGDPNFVLTSGSTPSATALAAYFNGFSSSGTFDDTYSFSFSQDGDASVNISTSFSSAMTTLIITNVIINGTDYGAPAATGSGQYWTLNDIFASSGTNTIEILGSVTGSGTYSGNVTFVASAVPESAIWTTMVAGFGMVGASFRRPRRPAPR